MGTIISKINIFPNKQTFHIHITIIKIKIKIKIIKNNSSLSQIYFKIYSNVTTHNQGCEYV